MSDPWSAPADRRRAYDESLAAYEKTLAALSVRLDEIHGERRSPRYWRIVLGPWLIRFAQIVRDRYERIRRGNAPVPRLAAADRVVPRDAYELIVRSHGGHYNDQLNARIAEALGVAGGGFSQAPPPAPALPRAKLPTRLVARALRLGAALARPDSAACDLGLPLAEVSRFAFPLPLLDPALPRPPLDPARRARLRGLPASGEFETVLTAVLPDEFPWLHLEGRAAHEEAVGAGSIPAPKVLISADGWHYNEAFKTAAGAFAERGTRLVAVQHGGGYGQYERIWHETLERAAADSYWCWGWAGLEGGAGLRSVPAPSLSVAPDSGAPGEGIVLVGTDQPLWRYGFQSQALGEGFRGYLDARNEFLAELGPLRAGCSVRLASSDFGWKQPAELTRLFPEVKVEPAAGPLHERLRSCALAVVDHPATSLLEALALDRPTLMFWNPEVWDCRPSAKPLLDGLRRAGVLFDEPRAAARAAAEAMKDPRAWWSRPEVREAVGAFRASLALSSPDWRRRWAEALDAELAAARGAA